MAGQTGSGFGGIQSLIIADQIILNRMYQDELKRRQKSNWNNYKLYSKIICLLKTHPQT